MLIQQKYDYKPLNRINSPNGRRYIVGEDRALPSVTTILSKMKDLTHLKAWVERVGEVEAEKIKTTASNLGNGMHKNLENYITGVPMTGTLMSKALANVIIKNGMRNVNEIWGSEVALYSTGLYAGTTDVTGLHNNIPAIIDFKNSLRDKKKEWIDDYFMQLTAYAMSHNEMYGTNIAKGVVMIATRDAKYQEFVIEGSEFRRFETMWANRLYSYYDRFGFD
jgi:genome maintenance exonuclease 1